MNNNTYIHTLYNISGIGRRRAVVRRAAGRAP